MTKSTTAVSTNHLRVIPCTATNERLSPATEQGVTPIRAVRVDPHTDIIRGIRQMSRVAVACLAWLTLGCEGRTVRDHQPVLGPPPPRIVGLNDAADSDRNPIAGRDSESTTSIIPASYDSQRMLDHDLSGTQVVAMVNGHPLFADDILLGRYGSRLDRVAEQHSAEEVQKLRLALIERHLEEDIERELLIQALRSTLKKEQMESLEQQIDEAFPKYLDFVMEKSSVGTRAELEDKLAADGTSLNSLKQSFANQQMAIAYLSAKTGVTKTVSREDLLAYYRRQIDDYNVPAQVKWQQIVIRFDSHDGKSGAIEATRQVLADLGAGADFGEVARKHSDGATAAENGLWDWTQRGSLADERIEKLIFELPPQTPSDVVVGTDRFEIVQVVERQEEGRIAFEKVQRDIESQLRETLQETARTRVLEEVHARANIVTIFDEGKMLPAEDNSRSL